MLKGTLVASDQDDREVIPIKTKVELTMKQSTGPSLLLFTAMMFAPSAMFATDLPEVTSPKTTPAVVSATTTTEGKKESPRLLVPMFSSNPKLGTSIGFMATYMHYFDQK